MIQNYKTTPVFDVCYQILGGGEEYPNNETTPVLHVLA